MKMADEYIHFETNNLRPLCKHLFGSWESKTWGHMGSTSQAINLDDIDGGNTIQVDTDGDSVNEYHYLLPVINEVEANNFREKCGILGIVVEMLDYDEAIAKWAELKALKPVKVSE